MITNNDELKALYSSDLDLFLTKLGKKEEFYSSAIHCLYCGTIITRENLYAFVPIHDDVQVCCNRPECMIKLVEEAQK